MLSWSFNEVNNLVSRLQDKLEKFNRLISRQDRIHQPHNLSTSTFYFKTYFLIDITKLQILLSIFKKGKIITKSCFRYFQKIFIDSFHKVYLASIITVEVSDVT